MAFQVRVLKGFLSNRIRICASSVSTIILWCVLASTLILNAQELGHDMGGVEASNKIDSGRSQSLSRGADTLELHEKIVVGSGTRVHREKEVSRIRLSREELHKIAAAQGDPMRALSTLPGVTNQNDLSVRPFVRGGKSEETQVLWEGIPLLQPYHFASLYSVFNMESIEDLTLYSGGFPVEMGNALSGALFMHARPEPLDSLSLYTDVSMLRGNIYAGVPIVKNKFGISLAYQAFWYDWVFNRGLDVIDLFTDDEGFSRDRKQIQTFLELPNFKDLQLGASWNILPGLDAHYTGIISRDVFIVRENRPHLYVNNNLVSPNYYDWDLYYGKKTNTREKVVELDTSVVVSVDNGIHGLRLNWKPTTNWEVNQAFAYQFQGWHIGFLDHEIWFDSIASNDDFAGKRLPSTSDYLLKIRNETYDWRSDAKGYIGDKILLKLGAAQSLRTSHFEAELPRPLFETIVNGNTDALDALGFFNPDGFTIRKNDPFADSTSNYLTQFPNLIHFNHKGHLSANFLSAYTSIEFSFDPTHRLTLGIRGETDSYSQKPFFSPRVAYFQSLGKRDELTLASGLYSQSDFPFQIRDLNRNLVPEKAFHINTEWSHTFSPAYRLEVQIYQKNYFDMIVPYLVNTNRIDWTNGLVDDLDSAGFSALSKDKQDSITNLRGERKLNYRSGGVGKAAGTEISIFYNPTKTWGGWFSSEAGYSKRQDSIDSRVYDFRYQRPWALNWINYFKLPNRFELSIRGRFAAGLPYTDFVSYASTGGDGIGFSQQPSDPKNDTLFHVNPKNSSRYSSYSRWDFKLAKEIPIRGHKLETYFELWNAFNAPNFLMKDSRTEKWKFVDLNYPVPILFLGISGRW